MKTITSRLIGLACSCCALATANDDTTGCEFAHGEHHLDLAAYGLEPGEYAVIGDYTTTSGVFRCCGCGEDDYGDAAEVYALSR